jgi:hypothetical protein
MNLILMVLVMKFQAVVTHCCDVDAIDIAGLISFSADEVLVVTCVEEIEKGFI